MHAARLKAYAEILITMFIWGAATIVIKATLSGIEPIPFLIYRFSISSLFAIPFLPRITRLFRKPQKTVLLILLYALLTGPIGLGILFVGLNKTSVVNLSLVSAIEPLLLVMLGSKLFHDHLSKKAKLGILVALIGATLTLIEPLFSAVGIGSISGNVLISTYILSDMTSVIILKKLLKKNVDPIALTSLSFMVGFIALLPIVLYSTSPLIFIRSLAILPLQYHFGVLYMALFSGSIAYVLRARAQKTLSISEVSIFGYLSPFISTILALLFLNERITFLYFLGGLLIIFGVIIVELKRNNKN